ncbi:Sulfatase [Parapedobacter composti]|uniref:Sulfatase n=2 Tax=Parapedobacter composti TaxID=623281 RepID=A0A1I1M654_9SPHI|nr:Sulfatase [Parapedobacter composti]
MDEKVGDLIQLLEERDLMENTIIVFQSDHGFSREEIALGGGGTAGIYRGSKFSLFEGGIRVPAFITWRGRISANNVEDSFVTNIDWFPTLAEMCNIKLPVRKIDGKSMVPILNGKSDKGTHKTFFWQSLGTRENPQWAVRDGQWKLLHRPYEAEEEELTEDGYFLVNLKDDPAETTNLAGSHPDIVNNLFEKYSTWIKNVDQQK